MTSVSSSWKWFLLPGSCLNLRGRVGYAQIDGIYGPLGRSRGMRTPEIYLATHNDGHVVCTNFIRQRVNILLGLDANKDRCADYYLPFDYGYLPCVERLDFFSAVLYLAF